MATAVFGKVALKTPQKMSLNERFQLLRQNQTRRAQSNANPNKIINRNQNAVQLRQGSQKNRRLALQMANRPSVIAALRANNNNQGIKQRLGNQRFNNQTNVTTNQNSGQRNINARNRNQKRFLNRSNVNTVAVNRNRVNRNQARTQFQNRRNNSQNIGVVVGVRQTVRKAIKKNRLRKAQSLKITSPTKANIRQRKKGIGGQLRNQTQNKAGGKKFRINRNFNARNTGGQQQQKKRQNVKLNKEQLDNDLDAYMAGTKSHLDAELDAYMSQTN